MLPCSHLYYPPSSLLWDIIAILAYLDHPGLFLHHKANRLKRELHSSPLFPFHMRVVLYQLSSEISPGSQENYISTF